VRLGFKAMPEDKEDQRVFDIKLQDKVVLESFDILKTAGRINRAVIKEFKGVRAEDALVLELLPHSTDPKMNQAPIINFIEVIREESREIALGKTSPM
ncbi:MAG: malectin domain-containing carbohydrate-binding protein, partial [Sedimentisphaerales bacterium]|nr:malectin domain-containing carbohydrate-binding protein [Sedimentisphaerales bacterium]